MSFPEQRIVFEPVLSGESVVGEGVDQTKEIVRSKKNVTRRINETYREIEKIRNDKNKFEVKKSSDYLRFHYRLHHLAAHPLSELEVPAYHHFDKPYWEVPYRPDPEHVFRTRVSPALEVWAGPLSWFPNELRALMVDMAMRVYASELLKTENIALAQTQEAHPNWGERRTIEAAQRQTLHLDAQLLLAMSHSFRDDHIVGMAFATPDGEDGEKHLIASIGAVKGMTDQPFGWTRGYDGSDPQDISLLSSIPTNAALYYRLNSIGKLLADVPEYELVEITRLNGAPKDYVSRLGVQRGDAIRALMFIIHEAIAAHFPEVKAEIFNTQMGLHRMIRQLGLPVEIIAEPETIRPTPAVLQSIHKHYFLRTPPIPQMITVTGALAATQQSPYHR